LLDELTMQPATAAARAADNADSLENAIGGRWLLYIGIAAIVLGLLLATMAVLLYRARPIVVMVPSVFVLASIVGIGVSAAIALGVGVANTARAVPLGITLAGALTLAGLQYGLSPAGRDPVQDMATIVLRRRAALAAAGAV